jgi:hypothetical protein
LTDLAKRKTWGGLMASQEHPRHEGPEQHLTPRELLHAAVSMAAFILFIGIAIVSFMAGLTWLGVIATMLVAAATFVCAKTAASRLCRLVPHVGAKAACTIAVRYHFWSAGNNVKAAYNRGGCVVVRGRGAYMSTPALAWKTIKFDNTTGTASQLRPSTARPRIPPTAEPAC